MHSIMTEQCMDIFVQIVKQDMKFELSLRQIGHEIRTQPRGQVSCYSGLEYHQKYLSVTHKQPGQRRSCEWHDLYD